MKETRKSWPRAFPPEICARHRADGYWGEMTLSAMFAETAARAPERLALVDPPNRAAFFEGAPRRFSYREMSREIDRYAAAFRRHGIGAGALVATQLPNISELVIIFLALAKIGAIVSPISIAYRANELRAMTSIVDFDAYLRRTRVKLACQR
jgi:non-ribosomal peptide synthetase component E (peptide arylation enzyme)